MSFDGISPGWTAERAWHYSADDEGHVGVMPITIVKSPDADYLELFPRTPRRHADASAAKVSVDYRPPGS